MTETVVHVTALEQWKSVLDVWFKQGYEWASGERDYKESYFTNENSYYLVLTETGDIARYSQISPSTFIEYSEFMAQQKEDNKMEAYYVTQDQLDFLNTLYEELYSLDELLNRHTKAKKIFDDFSIPEGNAVLRYLGGDTTVEFKVKEPLYRLWRIDDVDDRVYMGFKFGSPIVATSEDRAFTAPLEEIEKWTNPAWKIEKVDD